jgi:hypothetical protein
VNAPGGWIIRIDELAGAKPGEGPIGQYVIECDFEARDGQGKVMLSHDPRDAKRFPEVTDAAAWLRTPSSERGPDGKPRRPMCDFSVTVVETWRVILAAMEAAFPYLADPISPSEDV